MPKGLYEFATNFWTWVWSRPPPLNKVKKKLQNFYRGASLLGCPLINEQIGGTKIFEKFTKSSSWNAVCCSSLHNVQCIWSFSKNDLLQSTLCTTHCTTTQRGDRSAETLKIDYVIYGQPLIRRKYHSHDDNICNNGSFLEFFIGRDAISAVHGPYMMRGNM